MELRQLVYFDTVARFGHFTRAAEHLHVAQPAVSAQVRRLEGELGVELFHRTTRTVRLTRAGEVFRVRVREILDTVELARVELDRLGAAAGGRVTLGAIQSLGPFDLPGCLAEFHRRFPGVEVVLRSGTTGRLLDELRRGDADLALAPLGPLPEHLAAEPLFTEELVLGLPAGHGLAGRPSLRLAQVAAEPFVATPEGSSLRAVLLDAAAKEGFTPHVQFETANLARAAELVAHGLGVALLPRSAARAIAAVSLHPEPLHRTVSLVRRKGKRQARGARACREFLLSWSARLAPPARRPG